MVQIFERASIASGAPLARAIASGWLNTADRIGRERMEDVMRRATKLLRLRNQIIDLTFLASEDLDKEGEHAFTRSSRGILPRADVVSETSQKRPIISRINDAIRRTRVIGP